MRWIWSSAVLDRRARGVRRARRARSRRRISPAPSSQRLRPSTTHVRGDPTPEHDHDTDLADAAAASPAPRRRAAPHNVRCAPMTLRAARRPAADGRLPERGRRERDDRPRSARYHVGSVILDGNSTSASARIRGVTAQLQELRTGARAPVHRDRSGGRSGATAAGAGLRDDPERRRSRAADRRRRCGRARRDWGGAAARGGRQRRSRAGARHRARRHRQQPADRRPRPRVRRTPRRASQRTASPSRTAWPTPASTPPSSTSPASAGSPATPTPPAGVTDTVTTRARRRTCSRSPRPCERDVPFVMMSTAIYTRIDPGTPGGVLARRSSPACCAATSGFRGVIVSDDLGAAAQVARVLARAACGALHRGRRRHGADRRRAPGRADDRRRLLARAQRNPAFQSLVDAAALRVLQAKQARGLLADVRILRPSTRRSRA